MKTRVSFIAARYHARLGVLRAFPEMPPRLIQQWNATGDWVAVEENPIPILVNEDSVI